MAEPSADFFLMVFRWFYKVFGSPRGSKLDLKLDLVLGGILEASWSYLGKVLGGQDAPQTVQDGERAKRASERSERSARSAGMQCQADRGDAIE